MARGVVTSWLCVFRRRFAMVTTDGFGDALAPLDRRRFTSTTLVSESVTRLWCPWQFSRRHAAYRRLEGGGSIFRQRERATDGLPHLRPDQRCGVGQAREAAFKPSYNR